MREAVQKAARSTWKGVPTPNKRQNPVQHKTLVPCRPYTTYHIHYTLCSCCILYITCHRHLYFMHTQIPRNLYSCILRYLATCMPPTSVCHACQRSAMPHKPLSIFPDPGLTLTPSLIPALNHTLTGFTTALFAVPACSLRYGSRPCLSCGKDV